MQPSSARTTITVCTRRRVVSSGISAVSFPFPECSPDTPWTLPPRQALQVLQAPVDSENQRLGERLPTADDRHEDGPGK
jgi:hypothetical protein